jgi:hypothetical protein
MGKPSKNIGALAEQLSDQLKKIQSKQSLKKTVSEKQKKSVSARPQRVDTDLVAYAAANEAPFAPEAVGARVCDLCNDGTLTGKSAGIFTLRSDSTGVASVMILANPLVSVVDLTTNTITPGSLNQLIGGGVAYGASSIANLANLMSTCRMVGGGFRVRNALPPTTATGRCIWAELPDAGDMIDYNLLTTNNGITNAALVQRAMGLVIGSGPSVQTLAGAPASILAFPRADEFTLQDVIADAMEFTFRKTSHMFENFHNTNDNTAVGSNIRNGTTVTTDGGLAAVQQLGNEDCVNYRGYSGYLLRFEGLPASTIVAEIEYIYHLEGGPPAPASATGVVEPDVTIKTHVDSLANMRIVDRSAVMKTVKFANQVMAGDYMGAIQGAARFGSIVMGKKNARLTNEYLRQTGIAKLGISF